MGKAFALNFALKQDNNYFNQLQKDGKGLIIQRVLYESQIKNDFYNSISKLIDPERIKKTDVLKMLGIGAILATSALTLPLLGGTIGGSLGSLSNWEETSKKLRQQRIQEMFRTIGISDIENKSINEILLKIMKAYFPFFKHECFKSEDEIRLVYFDDKESSSLKSNLKYRTSSNGMIVPYFSSQDLLPADKNVKLPISRVIIGPVARQDWIIESVKYFLANNGYKDVKVEPSNIPFRG